MAGHLTTEQARALAAKAKHHNGGRKRKEEEDVIKAALDKAMPLDDVMNMFALAVKSRDPWAIPLWLGYHFGKPVERQEITGADGGPMEWHVIYDRKPDAT